MVLDFLITLVFSAIRLLLTPLPDIPSMDQDIVAGAETIFAHVEGATGIIVTFMSVPIYVFALTVTSVLLLFDPLYKGILWVLRKLPVGTH